MHRRLPAPPRVRPPAPTYDTFRLVPAGQSREGPGERRCRMWLWILLLILVIVVFGLGFVVKWLFWIALALFVIWLITLLVDRLRRK